MFNQDKLNKQWFNDRSHTDKRIYGSLKPMISCTKQQLKPHDLIPFVCHIHMT